MDRSKLATAAGDAIGSHQPAANNAAIVTGAAKAGYKWMITGYTISSDVASSAVSSFQIVTDSAAAATVLEFVHLPTGVVVNKTVEFSRPLPGTVAKDVKATLAVVGAAVKGSVVLRGFQIKDDV